MRIGDAPVGGGGMVAGFCCSDTDMRELNREYGPNLKVGNSVMVRCDGNQSFGGISGPIQDLIEDVGTSGEKCRHLDELTHSSVLGIM
jgi:hypothetical protein